MAIGDDFSISETGDIRYTGSGTTYTVIAFHRWLGDLMDDAQAAGNDILDITDATASERATDNLITLNAPYNIDEYAARYLYDGSIVQSGGAEIFDGIVCFAPAGTPLAIIQNGAVLAPNFWGTAYNADATQGISHRFMVKVRTAGADIDGRRLRGQTRNFGNTYSEFNISAGTSRGNNVLALTFANDLNNGTATATVAGWTTIVNTEGYRLLDVNNDTVNEAYYSEWDRASFTINQFYERMKWLSQESVSEDNGTDTGTNYAVGNGTIFGQGQSFSIGANNKHIMRVRLRVRKVGSPTGNAVVRLYTHSGTFGSSSVPVVSPILATSLNVDVAQLTTTYAETEFGFTTTAELTASTNYVLTIEYSGGDGSNYIEVEGAAAGAHGGNRSELTGSWAASAAADLWFTAYGCADLYGIPGELFRGITHQITVDTPTGTFNAVERVSWAGGTGLMYAINSPTAATLMWIQILTGVAPTDGQTITGADSFATVDVNATVTDRTVSQPFIGQSTGSAIIGAYGVGIQPADLTASDLLFDLTNTQRQPPNNVVFTVSGLEPLEDYVIVGPLGYVFAFDNYSISPGPFVLDETLTFTTPAGTATLSKLQIDVTTGFMVISEPVTGDVPVNNSTITGGTSNATADVNGAVSATIDVRQLELQTTLSGATELQVDVTATIPSDSPSSGTIRVQLDSGIFRKLFYSSIQVSPPAFLLSSGQDFTTDNATAGNSVYISYLDILTSSTSENFTVVYAADRNLFIRVRDGGGTPIKTFETTGTIGSGGGSSTAIRTTDA